MKDFTAIAKTWLAQLADKLSGGAPEQIEGTSTMLEEETAALAALLQAAYDDGVVARQADKDAPPEVEVLSDRKEDELLRKTEKILGAEARTLPGLRQAPHKLRAVAQFAHVDAKVLKDFLDGRKTREVLASMIRRSLRQLGYPSEPGAPS